MSPTIPLRGFLERDISIAESKDIADIACPLLEELVNYSTHVLGRCFKSGSGRPDEDAAPFVLFRHIIEQTDGIEILLRKAAPLPAISLLRSSFEAIISLDYILKSPDKYVERSLSWLVGYIRNRISMYEQFDPRTQKGKQFAGFSSRDAVMRKIKMLPPHKPRAAIINLKKLLSENHLSDIASRFEKERPRKWYSLGQGPASIEQLADYVGRGAQYQVLYRYWSSTVHSEDLNPLIGQLLGDVGIRNTKRFREVAAYAASFQLQGILQILRKFRPEESIRKWYKSEVIERYRILRGAG